MADGPTRFEMEDKGHDMGNPTINSGGGGTYSYCRHRYCIAILRWDEDGNFIDARSNAHVVSCPWQPPLGPRLQNMAHS